MTEIPQRNGLYNPLLEALRQLGGSGSIEEIDDKVIELLDLPADLVEKKQDQKTGNDTVLEYRLGWAKTNLKKFGLLENSSRGVWSLTKKAEGVTEVDANELRRFVRARNAEKPGQTTSIQTEEILDINVPEGAEQWRAELYRVLTMELSPAAFERLIQRVLRESGFVQVEVTGRSGDGGIDGKGIAKVHGIMSFHIIFQCKRYQGSVSSGDIRNFRGALVGRGDKGLFITTGSFTRDASKEASRDGAPPIDLMDGKDLIEKLKELKLGVSTAMIEKVTIDPTWFQSI